MITGASGQLGQELLATAPAGVQCVGLTRAALDIADSTAVQRCLQQEQPQVVINAAAYTAVDQAESNAGAAQRANAAGPGNLAVACAETGARLIHISTDFVFDGSADCPYCPDTTPSPLGEYGRSKLAGERAVQAALPDALIIRTGWVYSAYGANFVKTMLRLMAEREELGVVADQLGTPTWAHGLAQLCWIAVSMPQLSGVYHWSDSGCCSWYDFAVAIQEDAVALGLLEAPATVRPITTAEYPTPAQRPAYSVLEKSDTWRDFQHEGVDWRDQLRAMLAQLREMQNA